ncbi:MAG: methionine--tRNA ligase subunit beta [Phycisphaerales bacterium]
MSEPATNAKPESPFKPEVTFDDFARLDLRVATITQAEPHPNADRLLKLQLDDGSGTPRQICAGVREFYDPESLVGKQIVIVANLAPRAIRGEESRGMLLAASNAAKGADDRRVVLMTPMSEIDAGSTVS